jgi:catechol 2,3-dioxygenase-like lactoylglutathione lyase family enzyme
MRSCRPLIFACVLAFVVAADARGASATSQPAAEAVARIGVTVADINRSVDFFTKVLDFDRVADEEVAGPATEQQTGIFGARVRNARLRLGDEEIELTQFLAASQPGRPVPPDSRSNDRWFQHIAIVTSDIDAAYRRLRHFDVHHASTGPQRLPEWNKSAGGIAAFYFKDPDDHVLEVISFPPGKGDPRWESRRGLFLGIDHTAIVVTDTNASLAFYRDRLRLRAAGGSENYGDEQAHLNNVEGAHLRITTLRASAGPGVELLEYLTPRNGRPFPPAAKPNDLFHWQTVVFSDVLAPQLVRDPDGHALLLTPSK